MQDNIPGGIIRVGKVTSVDKEKLTGRVEFLDSGMTSGVLQILERVDPIPDYEGEQRTEFESGGSGDPAFANHRHLLSFKPWVPKVNDLVLVAYLPVRNGDGFILGGIRPWR